MIEYLGKPLTPREEVIYINAVLHSVVELEKEVQKILEEKWSDGEVVERIMQVGALNYLIEAEWRRWLHLYDQGQKYEWETLPQTMTDVYRELGWQTDLLS